MQTKIPNFKENQNTELPRWIVVLMNAYEEYLKEQKNKYLEIRNGNPE